MKKILTTALLLTLCQHGLAFSLKDTLREIANETAKKAAQSNAASNPSTTKAVQQQTPTQAKEDKTTVQTPPVVAINESTEDTLSRISGIPKSKLLVWDYSDVQFNAPFSSDEEKVILHTLNKFVEDQFSRDAQFNFRNKDEYEKTADYTNKRQEALNEFNKSLPITQPDVYRFDLLKKYFTPVVSSPRITDVSYNADSEILTLYIKSSHLLNDDGIQIPLSVKTDPVTAKKFKDNYYSLDRCYFVHVAMEWNGASLTAKHLLLDFNKQNCYGEYIEIFKSIFNSPAFANGIATNYTLPIKFGKATAANYANVLSNSKNATSDTNEKSMKSKKWYPLYSSINTQSQLCKTLKNEISLVSIGSDPATETKTYQYALNMKSMYPQCFR